MLRCNLSGTAGDVSRNIRGPPSRRTDRCRFSAILHQSSHELGMDGPSLSPAFDALYDHRELLLD
jgi:hypothetical protein